MISRMMTLLVATAVAATSANAVAQDEKLPPAGKNYAVLIATRNFNNSAVFPSLKNTVNDMEALGQVLESRYGFEVTRLFEDKATLANVEAELGQRLPDKVREGDSVLVAFATHGKYSESDKQGFLILKDTENYKTGISFDHLNRYAKNEKMRRARAILFMLDACEMGRVETVEFRSVNTPPEHVFRKYRGIVTSGGYVPVKDSSDRDGSTHSPFAEALLELLGSDSKPKQMYDVWTKLGQSVKAKTSDWQTPRMRKLPSDEDGDFVFQPVGASARTRGDDQFQLVRDQLSANVKALTRTDLPEEDLAEGRRTALAWLQFNKAYMETYPADIQRDYVQLLALAWNPKDAKESAKWAEPLLDRAGDMGKLRLAQLRIASGNGSSGEKLLSELATVSATRGSASVNQAAKAAALYQLAKLRLTDWRAKPEYASNHRQAVDHLTEAANLAQQAGQDWVAAGLWLRIGAAQDERLRRDWKAAQVDSAELQSRGEQAIEGYAKAGDKGRERIGQMQKWLESQRGGKTAGKYDRIVVYLGDKCEELKKAR